MSARIQVNRVSGNEIERLLPVLVHIQANLDQDLSLEVLAKRVRLSQFHFHRLFRSAVGETLKQYTQRLRLERSEPANNTRLHNTRRRARLRLSKPRDVLARVQTQISSHTEKLPTVGSRQNARKPTFGAWP